MNNWILIKTPKGQDVICIDEIAYIHQEDLSFKRSTIVLKNKHTVDSIETPFEIYQKINNKISPSKESIQDLI